MLPCPLRCTFYLSAGIRTQLGHEFLLVFLVGLNLDVVSHLVMLYELRNCVTTLQELCKLLSYALWVAQSCNYTSGVAQIIKLRVVRSCSYTSGVAQLVKFPHYELRNRAVMLQELHNPAVMQLRNRAVMLQELHNPAVMQLRNCARILLSPADSALQLRAGCCVLRMRKKAPKVNAFARFSRYQFEFMQMP